MTQFKATDEYVRLLAFVEDCIPDEIISYSDIGRITGVLMDASGKGKLRRAILASKRDYKLLPTVGYQIMSAGTATEIMASRMGAIDSRIRRASHTVTIIEEQFLGEMADGDRNVILYSKSVIATFHQASQNARKVYNRKNPVVGSPAEVELPPLPEMRRTRARNMTGTPSKIAVPPR